MFPPPSTSTSKPKMNPSTSTLFDSTTNKCKRMWYAHGAGDELGMANTALSRKHSTDKKATMD
jgi:hypothetical protein